MSQCKAIVKTYGKGRLQCSRQAFKDGYCRTHHPDWPHKKISHAPKSELIALRSQVAELQHKLRIETKFRESTITKPCVGHDYWERYFKADAEAHKDMAAELAALREKNAELERQLREFQSECVEYLCANCNTIHPVQSKGKLVQLCPTCGMMMNFTSSNIRRITELQRQLDEAAKQEPVGKVCQDGMTITWDWARSGLNAGDYVYAKPINPPALIEQAKAEEREDAERYRFAKANGLIFADQDFIHGNSACGSGRVADSYADSFIDSAIQARKP